MYHLAQFPQSQNFANMEIVTKQDVAQILGLSLKDFYLLLNGKICHEFHHADQKNVKLVPTVLGGKGGFGSMLRAIGAQIEKTTNREACRDLSGRRLRDINEEKRLKKWINQQAEREKQADDRRQKKLERLCQKPKHEFKDEDYDKERSLLPEKIEDALEQGLKASSGSSGAQKRKCNETNGKNKKTKIWLDSEEELSSSPESDDENSSTVRESSNDSNEAKCFDTDSNEAKCSENDSNEVKCSEIDSKECEKSDEKSKCIDEMEKESTIDIEKTKGNEEIEKKQEEQSKDDEKLNK